VSGAVPEVGVTVNAATGTVDDEPVTVIVCVNEFVLVPTALPAVNETV